MADTGAPYNLPYQAVGDSPNGAQGLQDLATATHTQLAGIDAKITTLNGLTQPNIGTTADETGFTSTSFVPGATVVGTAFTAPASGNVLIMYGGQISQNINGNSTFLSPEVRTGSTVGSGTLVGAAANSDRALVCGKAVTSGGVAMLQASRHVLYSGLTPGASYNVRLLHCVDGGSGTVFLRDIVVLPQL